MSNPITRMFRSGPKKDKGAKGYTKSYLQGQIAETLLPDEKRKWSNLLDQYPALNAERNYFTPDEIRVLIKRPKEAKRANEILTSMPKASDMGEVMQLGKSKLGWYENSSKAIQEVFGEDAPLFARVLASTSPQTTVDKNLENALKFWNAWEQSGRTTDPAKLKEIRSKTGGMSTYDNNLINSLAHPEEVLSGPKVNSFGNNLLNSAMFVTNDVWNAKGMGIEQDYFAGDKKSPTDPGYGGGYLAAAARVRAAADEFGWTPAEGQETYWSTLYALGQKGGVAANLAKKTHQDVGGTPDFSMLLREPRFASHLSPERQQRLAQMNIPAREIPQTPLIDDLSPAQRAAAERGGLGNLQRDMDSALMENRQKAWGQETAPKLDRSIAPATLQHEGIPYHAAGLGGLPIDSAVMSNRITEPFINPFGNDRLLAAMGVDTQLRRQKGKGVYQPPGTDTMETNPVSVTGTMVDLTKGGKVPAKDRQAFETAARIKASMTAQGGVPYSIPVLDPRGEALYKPRADAKGEAWKDVIYRDAEGIKGKDMAVADMGRGALRMGFGEDSIYELPKPIGLDMPNYPRPEDLLPSAPGLPQNSVHGVPVRNEGAYVGYEGSWEQPGENLIAEDVLSHYSKLPLKARKQVDAELQGIAPELLDTYKSRKVTRPDFLRYLELLKEGGLPAVDRAIQQGEKLIQSPGSNPFGGYA
jgi:hypothetical protein